MILLNEFGDGMREGRRVCRVGVPVSGRVPIVAVPCYFGSPVAAKGSARMARGAA